MRVRPPILKIRHMIGMRFCLFVIGLLLPTALSAGISVGERPAKGRNSFPLSTPRVTATILHDPAEPEVVKRCAELFAADVEAVTGRRPQIVTSLPESGQLVIVGTVEKSALIQRIARAGKIDIRALDGAW